MKDDTASATLQGEEVLPPIEPLDLDKWFPRETENLDNLRWI